MYWLPTFSIEQLEVDRALAPVRICLETGFGDENLINECTVRIYVVGQAPFYLS
jgi:hypothetical protein